jgi:hypothetical protein
VVSVPVAPREGSGSGAVLSDQFFRRDARFRERQDGPATVRCTGPSASQNCGGEAEMIALDARARTGSLVHLWLGAPLGAPFSISTLHKSKNARRMTATIGPLELAGLAAT